MSEYAKQCIGVPEGYLPDFEGKPILASCKNCKYYEDVSDGPEYGGPYYSCTKEGKEHMANLIHWPFKTPQKCCELHIAYTVNWESEAKASMEKSL
ncbi:hypothetical protein EYS14_03620 [Alteromonadaceae bacterium M269]|nr:hypothetical protein EYS14_03620 [Alteromonadaceae bacterium M269]